MQRFDYKSAANISEAVDLLNVDGCSSRPIAGGTDLLLQIKADPAYCDRVVDVTRIPELRKISMEEDIVVIGAGVTFHEVIQSTIVRDTGSVLVQACQQIGAEQIRNMGTLGGNVANAAACADSLPALVCLDATARVAVPGQTLEWTVSELVLGPNRTKIPLGGLLTSIRYQAPKAGTRGVFLKLGRRNAMAISRLTVAVMGRLDEDGRISELRYVPGATTPQVTRWSAVEEAVFGQKPSEDLFRMAGDLAAKEMIRLAGRRWSSEYKERALAGMTVRAFAQLFPQTN